MRWLTAGPGSTLPYASVRIARQPGKCPTDAAVRGPLLGLTEDQRLASTSRVCLGAAGEELPPPRTSGG